MFGHQPLVVYLCVSAVYMCVRYCSAHGEG